MGNSRRGTPVSSLWLLCTLQASLPTTAQCGRYGAVSRCDQAAAADRGRAIVGFVLAHPREAPVVLRRPASSAFLEKPGIAEAVRAALLLTAQSTISGFGDVPVTKRLVSTLPPEAGQACNARSMPTWLRRSLDRSKYARGVEYCGRSAAYGNGRFDRIIHASIVSLWGTRRNARQLCLQLRAPACLSDHKPLTREPVRMCHPLW
jgi:hypothetical protein